MDASCCPFPSAQRLESFFGEVFWGIHFKSMYIDFLSSHRNCVQLSQPVLAYATASLLPPCPRSPFSFFVSSDFREQTMAACAAGIPFVSWAETTRDFRSRTGLFRPQQELPHHHLSKSNLGNLMGVNIFIFLGFMYRSCVETTLLVIHDAFTWVGRVARNEGNALKTLGRHHQKRSDAADPPRPLRDKESNRQGTDK